MHKRLIIKTQVNCVAYHVVLYKIIMWSRQSKSAYICFANVHMIMEAYDSAEYQKVINSADIVAPDGMPLVWMMRLNGQKSQERVYGPTLMLQVLESAARHKIPVGFYGGKPEVLKMLVEKMCQQFHGLEVAYSFSPSFLENSKQEESAIEEIKNSKTRILFVGLGCPKQEIWMAKHKDRLNVVMLGVGAAFDFHADAKPQAPPWMQKSGLEWFFRFITEPHRLWKRYLYHNPRFIFLVILDLLGLLK